MVQSGSRTWRNSFIGRWYKYLTPFMHELLLTQLYQDEGGHNGTNGSLDGVPAQEPT